MQDRPNHSQLQYFANLINGRENKQLTAPDLGGDEFVEQLDYHGITLLALQNGTLSSAVSQKLASRKALMAANNVLQTVALTELFEAFDKAGLTNSILFKGSALAHTIYRQPWLRPRSDSDCLIDYADYNKFAAVLEQLGFKKHFAVEGKHISYQNSFSKQLVGQATINIDLHWRINNRQTLASCFDVHELVGNSQRLSAFSDAIKSEAIKIPCPIDSLLIACVHRLGHHQREERLAWLYDIHLLASVLTQNEWQQLCDKASDKKLAAITLDALEYCKDLFDTPLPNAAEDALKSLASRKEPSQLFLKRDLPEWKIFVCDLNGLAGWQNKLRLILENVFPNPAYVRQQMETDNILLAYARRIARGLRRITR